MLDTGEFSKESQKLTYWVLTGYGLLVLCFAIVTIAVIMNAYCRGYKKETAEQISWFVVQFGLAVAASLAYFVGDNTNDAKTNDDIEETDLTVISIISLIGAKLGYKIIPYITKCGKSSINTLCQMCLRKRYSEEPCENCQCRNDNLSNPVKLAESMLYAVILTMAIIPEVDATFTILYSLISLTTDTCRTRKYNTLWILYGGIILIALLETIYGMSQAFNIYFRSQKKAKKEKLDAKGWLCSISFIVVAVLAVIVNGLVFVADNELPLDCSPHFNIVTHTRRNYTLRVAFLTVSLGLSLVIFFIQLGCWLYFLYQYHQINNSRAEGYNMELIEREEDEILINTVENEIGAEEED